MPRACLGAASALAISPCEWPGLEALPVCRLISPGAVTGRGQKNDLRPSDMLLRAVPVGHDRLEAGAVLAIPGHEEVHGSSGPARWNQVLECTFLGGYSRDKQDGLMCTINAL